MGGDGPTTTTLQMLEALRDPANQAVWAALDERFRPIVCGLALRSGLAHEDAADVAQQTLVDVMTGFRAGRYDREKGRFRVWILTIAKRRVLDVLRRHYRAQGQEADTALGQAPTPEAMEQAWDQEQQRAVLREALRILEHESQASASSKRVFELVQLRGMPVEAAAAECGLSADQVYVAKHRMLKRLREIIATVQEAYGLDEWK